MSCYELTTVPLPPKDVVVTGKDPASLNVSWKLPVEGPGSITGHVIQYTRVGSSDIGSINVTSGTTHTIPGLVANVEYSIRVAAVNDTGAGEFSEAVICTSGEDSKFIETAR